MAERNSAIETDYRAIVDVFPPFADHASLGDFKWARMCVCSRNFGIVVDGLRTSAMVSEQFACAASASEAFFLSDHARSCCEIKARLNSARPAAALASHLILSPGIRCRTRTC